MVLSSLVFECRGEGWIVRTRSLLTCTRSLLTQPTYDSITAVSGPRGLRIYGEKFTAL